MTTKPLRPVLALSLALFGCASVQLEPLPGVRASMGDLTNAFAFSQ